MRDWYIQYGGSGASMTTIADKLTGKVVGEPYRGKPDVRFDEGEMETGPTENPLLARVNTHPLRFRAISLLYSLKKK